MGTAKQRGLLCFSLALMLLVRVALAIEIKGFVYDVQTFQAWAIQAANDLPGFYSSGIFVDYPPGYIYVLFLIGKLKGLLMLETDSRAFWTLIKLPAIVADLAAVVLIYRVAAVRLGGGAALVLALMYGFNPAIVINSAVWGQVDAVFTLFIALSLLYLSRELLVGSAVAYAIALLIKPQALIFTPLLLFAVTGRPVTHESERPMREVLLSVAAGVGTFIAGILLFVVQEGPLWVFQRYGTTLASYPYATMNAFNLFALSGGNFMPESDSWIFFTYRSWGFFFIVAATLFAMIVYFSSREKARVPYAGGFLIAAVFLLAPRMHERYLFPVLILLMLTYIFSSDRRLLLIFAGFSMTHFLNVAQVLVASLHGIYPIPRYDPLLRMISVANLLLFAYMASYGVMVWVLPAVRRSGSRWGRIEPVDSGDISVR